MALVVSELSGFQISADLFLILEEAVHFLPTKLTASVYPKDHPSFTLHAVAKHQVWICGTGKETT